MAAGTTLAGSRCPPAQPTRFYARRVSVGEFGEEQDPAVAALAVALLADAPAIAVQMAERIRRDNDFYASREVVHDAELIGSCQGNVEYMIRRLMDPGTGDLAPARQTGRRRAEQGAPLPAVLHAYRIGTRLLWETVIERAHRSRAIPDAALVVLASRLWVIGDELAEAMTTAYRDVLTEQTLGREQERSALVEALLEGRIGGTTGAWEVARLLRLPYQGPFVLVAAELPELARAALPGVAGRLEAYGIASAWRLLPDLQVGIANVRQPDATGRLLAALRAVATGRVGVAPPYEELTETATALRYARIALTCAGSGPARVSVFGDTPLAAVVAAAPDISQHVAAIILGPMLTLPPDDRAILLDTLDTWFRCAGSATAAAAELYCHPNTVRHRIRRIEQQTGRKLDDPAQAAELRIALEAVQQSTPKP